MFDYMYMEAEKTGFCEIKIEGLGSMKFEREVAHEADSHTEV